VNKQDTDNPRPGILVVDDDHFFLSQIVDILSDGGFRAEGAGSGAEALERLKTGDYQVVVTDVVMKDMSPTSRATGSTHLMMKHAAK